MFDLIIRNGKVIDGTGAKAYYADIGVTDGKIVAVCELKKERAAKSIEAAGKYVCPGFIDIHTHNDCYIFADNHAVFFEPFLRQGITTCITGNCGMSGAPWLKDNFDLLSATLRSFGLPKDFKPEWETQAEFHAYLKRKGLPLNFVTLTAHSPIRIGVMGDAARFCSQDELNRMKDLVRKGMEAGCRGFSSGLTYYPGMYAHTEEIVELAKVAAEYGGRYATHVRGHSGTYDKAVAEAIDIARRSGCSLQLSHVFCVPHMGSLAPTLANAVNIIESINKWLPLPGYPNTVLSKAMRAVNQALDEGMDIGMDFIPYVLGNTTIAQLFPPWANVGGTEGLVRRLSDPLERAKIKHDIEHKNPQWPHWEPGSWSDNFVKNLSWNMMSILAVDSDKNRHVEGRKIVELSREAGKDPFDFVADLTVEEDGAVTFVFGMPPRPWTEKILTRVQAHPEMSVGADAIFSKNGDPPPSAYGCFVRVLEHYVKEIGLYTIEEAVYRMTGLSAKRYNLHDRGVLKKDAAADIVIFDHRIIRDNATLEDPKQFPTGIDYVLLNGHIVVEKDNYRGDLLAGHLL